MAAIDPTAEPELESADDKQPPRSTLKVIRVPDHLFDSDDDSDDDDYAAGLEDDDEDSEDDEDDEEVNGGPSERKSKKQALLEALAKDEEEDEDMADDDEDDEDDDEADAKAIATLEKLLKNSKGKGKAIDGEDLSDEDEDSDDESIEMDEVVVCTLDPTQVLQTFRPFDLFYANWAISALPATSRLCRR